MTQCKRCLSLISDVFYHISAGRYEQALEDAEELVKVLKTYKESC